MIFGSHNSLTYLTPKTLKMKLLNFHYKCQNKNLIDQIKSGVHVLDIKVRFDEENNLYVTNGKWESKNRYIFDDFINIILDTIHIHRIDNDDMYIYLTLDTDDVFLRQEINFIQFVNKFKNKIGDDNIFLMGGHRSCDNEKIILTINDELIVEPIAGVDKRTRLYERICPRWFAKRMNETNKKMWGRVTEKTICLFDYV